MQHGDVYVISLAGGLGNQSAWNTPSPKAIDWIVADISEGFLIGSGTWICLVMERRRIGEDRFVDSEANVEGKDAKEEGLGMPIKADGGVGKVLMMAP